VLAVLQLVFVYAPFMQRLFGSTALEPRHWLVPLGIDLAVFLIVEAEKAIFRRFGAEANNHPAHLESGAGKGTQSDGKN
jgi:hypothetical protein